MKPGANFKTSVFGPLGIIVAFIKRQIGQVYSKSVIFSGKPSMSPFIDIIFSHSIETWPKCWWIIWERFFFESAQTVGTKIFLSLLGLVLINLYLKMVKIFLSLVGWYPRKTLRVNKVTMFKRFRHNLLKSNIKSEVAWWDGVGRVTWTIINWSHWIYNGTVRKAT